jgi:hypothetical protein
MSKAIEYVIFRADGCVTSVQRRLLCWTISIDLMQVRGNPWVSFPSILLMTTPSVVILALFFPAV